MGLELDLHAESYETLSTRLQGLHDRLLEIEPGIQRVACALYDAEDDLLKTFINSTRDGRVLRAYQYRLADSESLSYLARTRELRLLDDIQSQLVPTTQHSTYVLGEGYASSFTVPMVHQGDFLGFIFFDSKEKGTFSSHVQRELLLYTSIITMAIVNELVAVRSIVSTVQIARDFTELRDLETGAHLERMARYARLITRTLVEPLDLSDEYVEHVFLYAPLHDIGKIGIPDRILLKAGKLDPDEWEIMKTHTTKGREMIDQITADLRLDNLPADSVLRNIVELHHEKLDGSGYPFGLQGSEVPLESRIVTVADMFDALTSPRPYKPAWSFDDAFAHLRDEVAAGRLDERCVDALEANRPEAERIRDTHPESA